MPLAQCCCASDLLPSAPSRGHPSDLLSSDRSHRSAPLIGQRSRNACRKLRAVAHFFPFPSPRSIGREGVQNYCFRCIIFSSARLQPICERVAATVRARVKLVAIKMLPLELWQMLRELALQRMLWSMHISRCVRCACQRLLRVREVRGIMDTRCANSNSKKQFIRSSGIVLIPELLLTEVTSAQCTRNTVFPRFTRILFLCIK